MMMLNQPTKTLYLKHFLSLFGQLKLLFYPPALIQNLISKF